MSGAPSPEQSSIEESAAEQSSPRQPGTDRVGADQPGTDLPPVAATAHLAHWGSYDVLARPDGQDVAEVRPWSGDADPSPLLGNIPGSVTHRSRVDRPYARRSWLEAVRGERTGAAPSMPDRAPQLRGADEYVPLSWDDALQLAADEVSRVIATHGNEAIYGGSYGWASAGRFHHAQSQLHRFLNCIGGYTRSVNTYSTGAAEVLMPRILASEATLTGLATHWDVVAEHTELLVAVGGVPVKNTGTASGGVSIHPTADALRRLVGRGGQVVSVSPLRDDFPQDLAGGVTWVAPRPATDTALLLALGHTLLVEGLADLDFVARYCSGADAYLAELRGERDGVVKDADWAAGLTEIPAETIRDLARRMATHRTLVTVTWSLQRARFGEQVLWAGVALAAMLGQIGLPGGGYASGYGSMNKSGISPTPYRLPRLPQGINPVTSYLPVAAISEALLRPGEPMTYDGGTLTLPELRLVWWAGGNPFHHHQDIPRLRRALRRPETIIVHEPYWTAMARHADLVFPSTTSLERDDLGGSTHGAQLVAMKAATSRYAQARDDYDTFAGIAARLGDEVAQRFTEGRSAAEWLRHLYDAWVADVRAGHVGRMQPRQPDGCLTTGPEPVDLPSYDEFVAAGRIDLPRLPPLVSFADFRADPDAHPLLTPTGRIVLGSPEIAALDLWDMPGHPAWITPFEWLGADAATSGRLPLHLIANQPRTRLHSQLDHGATSQASKVAGREPIRIHPDDAAERGITAGDVVLVSNDRGRLLAGAVLDEGVRAGVVQLSTGAWYDPLDPADPDAMCVHGNPNVLTADTRTSGLTQGCAGQHALVQVRRWSEDSDGPVPPVRCFEPPPGAGPDADRGPGHVPDAGETALCGREPGRVDGLRG